MLKDGQGAMSLRDEIIQSPTILLLALCSLTHARGLFFYISPQFSSGLSAYPSERDDLQKSTEKAISLKETAAIV